MASGGGRDCPGRRLRHSPERVLKMMFLTRLSLILASLMAAGTGAIAAVVLCLTSLAAAPPKHDSPSPGPDDLPGRVVDSSGAGVAGVQIWSIDHSTYRAKDRRERRRLTQRVDSRCRG